jgi:hypothetical protein
MLMVNRRMRPAQLLALVRKLSRAQGLSVRELAGRGKGTHRLYAIDDVDGSEVARFGLTGHARDPSWTVMTQLEQGLTHLLGEKWTEAR